MEENGIINGGSCFRPFTGGLIMIRKRMLHYVIAVGCIAGMIGVLNGEALAENTPEEGNAVEETIAETAEEIELSEEERIPVSELSEALPENFFFSSGAGGWETGLVINDDWSFSGDFHDSEMGDNSEEYPHGTIYVCRFNGQFKEPEQISPYSFRLELMDLAQDGEEGDETIEDEIRYVVSYPYGLEDCSEFVLYLPGTPLTELDEDCQMWTNMYLRWEEMETLPEGFYILYNPAAGEAFAGMTDDYTIPEE